MLDRHFEYPVILEPDERGGYFVTVPDFKNGFTQGDTVAQAVIMAQDLIKTLVEDDYSLQQMPKPSTVSSVERKHDYPKGSFVSYVPFDYPATK